MKRLIFYTILLFATMQVPCKAQFPFFNDPFFNNPFANPFASSAKRQPEFAGGEKALLNYVQKNQRYPKKAKRVGIQGVVRTQFFINENGTITEPKVIEGIGYGCDEEALRLIRNMPAWKPATYNNKPVKVGYELPIVFKLTETDPFFKGGKKALDAFLQKTMTYPTEAVLDQIQGTVLMEFTITKKGKIKEAVINKSLHKLLDQEAIRMVQKMPDWIPATRDNKPIEKRVVMPIEFKLPKKKIQVI